MRHYFLRRLKLKSNESREKRQQKTVGSKEMGEKERRKRREDDALHTNAGEPFKD